MEILDTTDRERERGDPAHFTGTVHLFRLSDGRHAEGVKVFRVEFEPAARTHWHVHTGPQVLVVLEGTCRLAVRGGSVEEIGAGGAAVIPPGEKHWHGAAPGSRMVHLAINVRTETTWLEAVTDGAYDVGPR